MTVVNFFQTSTRPLYAITAKEKDIRNASFLFPSMEVALRAEGPTEASKVTFVKPDFTFGHSRILRRRLDP